MPGNNPGTPALASSSDWLVVRKWCEVPKMA
ncbi:hypothetical protein M2271_003120 [Streptomyces sp. LBL]|nr:hypothetical protein [Streptomyces sp. LBL]